MTPGDVDRSDLKFLHDALTRFLGFLEEKELDKNAALHNPLIWIREGVQVLLLLPVNLLVWFGIVGASTTDTVSHSAIFRLVSLIFTVVGVIGALFTIMLEWERNARAFG